MGGSANLQAIYCVNILGIVLSVVLIIANRWRLNARTTENYMLTYMIVSTLMSCILDPFAFTLDGMQGQPAFVAIWISSTLLYATNMMSAYCWVHFLCFHLNGTIDKRHKLCLRLLLWFGVLVLIANVFHPLVFSVDDHNVYQRGPLYWLYVAIDTVYIIDSLVVYGRARVRSGMLKLFPVWIFLIPVVAGMLVQSFMYGTSLVWACMAVSIGGVCASLQNEMIFRDKLTGLYNRFYLDNLKEELAHSKGSAAQLTAMMLDLNGFKRINDTHGHSTGDEALRETANLLTAAVGDRGTVVRYAGDEFVVLLNTQDEAQVQARIDEIRNSLEAFNRLAKRPYQLSVSIGYSALDLRDHSVDELMNEIDRKMYEDKRAFYEAHRELDRRTR